MSKKKFLALFLATALSVAMLAGCGNAAGGTDISNPEDTAKSAADSGTAKSDEQVTLSIISFMKFSDTLIQKFEQENPDIKVQYENFPGSEQYNDVFRARLAGGENLDIITSMPENMPKMVADGLIVELTGEAFLDNFIDPLFEIQQRRLGTDKVYYVGYENVVDGIWYNKDIFDQYGLAPAKTYDELIAICETLKANGVTPMINGFKDTWVNNFLLFPMKYPVSQKDGLNADLKSGAVKWNEDQELKAALDRAANLVQYHDPNSIGLSYDQAFQAFLQGKAAMWSMGSWGTELIQDASTFQPPFEIGVMINADAPTANDKSYITLAADTRAIAIYSKSEYPEQAKRFLEFYSRPENAQIHADETATLSNIKGVTPAGFMLDKWTALVSDGTPTDEWTARLEPSVLLSLEQGAQAIFIGDKTVEQVLNDVQKQQEIENSK